MQRGAPAPRPFIPGTAFSARTPISPNAARRQGIAFIGPTPAQMRDFGLKHVARALAEKSDLPLLAGHGSSG